MLRKVGAYIFIFGLVTTASSQPNPALLWQHSFGGPGNDHFWDVACGKDREIVAVGCMDCFDKSQRGFVAKFNLNGDTLWTRTIPSSFLWSIEALSDGSFAVAGFVHNAQSGDDDALLLKLDSNGNTVWVRQYGGPGNDRVKAIIRIDTSGFLLAGYTNSFSSEGTRDGYLVRTDPEGDTLWTRVFGGQGEDEFSRAAAIDDEGNFVLLGVSDSLDSGERKTWICKVRADGEMVWSRTYDKYDTEPTASLIPIKGNTCLVLGHRKMGESVTRKMPFLRKIDNIGHIAWTRDFGSSEIGAQPVDFIATDVGLVVTGTLFLTPKTPEGAQRLFLAAVDTEGNLIWSIKGESQKMGTALIQSPDSGYIIVGNNYHWTGSGNFDAYILKTGTDKKTK